MITKDILGIYWDSILGEVDGQTFYVLFNENNITKPIFPLEIWPHGTEIKEQKIYGKNWDIWIIDVKYSSIPENWKKTTKETLLYLIKNNASIGWCGLDGYFSDPPGLFNPQEMSGGVYAALTLDNKFICHTDFYDEYKPLLDEELIMLKKYCMI